MGRRRRETLRPFARTGPGRALLGAWVRRADGRRSGAADVHRVLLAAAFEQRRWNDGLVHARALLDHRPDDAGAWRSLARGLHRLGFFRDAADAYRRAAARRPDDPVLQENLGHALIEARRFAEGREALDRAAALDPRGRGRLGVLEAGAWEMEGRPEEARDALLRAQRVLAAGPGSPTEAHLRLQIASALGPEGDPGAVAASVLAGMRPGDPDARAWLLVRSHHALLDDHELALARACRREIPEDRELWFVPLHERARSGDAAGTYRALLDAEPAARESLSWSRLARSVAPGHFATSPAWRPPRGAAPPELGVVACFFNPCGYRSRLDAFRAFHAGLAPSGVRLQVVELATGDARFVLDGVPGIRQVRSPDVLWQKERLLNLGIEMLLDEGCECIAWLDADVVFERDDWGQRIVAALDRAPVCQVFDRVHTSHHERDVGRYHPGFALQVRDGAPSMQAPLSGYGWGIRAELLREERLFDEPILGGGDMLLAMGSLWTTPMARSGLFERRLGRLPAALAESFAAWAERWGKRVGGRVGVAEQPIQTLYHGTWSARRFASRDEVLVRHAFDPARDLAPTPEGAWRWASDKPALHREVAGYFRARREDAHIQQGDAP